MAITPSTTISDVLHLILADYLERVTQIDDWLNFDSALAPPDDGSVAYAAAVWPQSYAPDFGVTRKRAMATYQFGIRLMLAADDADSLTTLALSWTRTLADLIEATGSAMRMQTLGEDLSGTFEGVAVASGTTLGVSQSRWQIEVIENESGGAVAKISNVLEIVSP